MSQRLTNAEAADPDGLGIHTAVGLSVAILVVGFFGLYFLPQKFLGLKIGPEVWTWLTIGGISAGFAWKGEARRRRLRLLLHAHRMALLSYGLVAFLCFSLIVLRHPDPAFGLDFSYIYSHLTFGVILTHDNFFQFVNGKALMHLQPFDLYYANHALVYGVADREMLPGALFASVNTIAWGLNPGLQDNFALYTALAVLLDALFIFPLFHLAQRLFPKIDPRVLLFAVMGTAYMSVNINYAWFKMAGGSFVLMGICSLCRETAPLKRWVSAGFFCGLGVNNHASTALGLPLLCLWFVRREARRSGGRTAAAAFGGFFAAFVGCYLPWSVVKRLYFNDTGQLIREAFMNGFVPASGPAGLGSTYLAFWRETPLAEQFGHRLHHLSRFFKWDELLSLLRDYPAQGFNAFILRWDRLETHFIVFSMYPLILACALVLGSRIVRRKPALPRTWLPSLMATELTPAVTLTVAVGSILLLMAAGYTWGDPDSVFHLPFEILILFALAAAGMLLSLGRKPSLVFLVWIALQHARIIYGYHLMS